MERPQPVKSRLYIIAALALTAAVEHDKIVAEPMHLAERDVRHAAAYMAARPGMSNAARSRLALCGVPLAAAGALTLC